MKKVGREVCFLKTSKENARNGEGTFLRLRNQNILYVYSRFSGSDWDDSAPSDLAAIISADEGETWSDPQILIEHDQTSMNYMCPSLLRMQNGDIGLIYLRKFRTDNGEESAVVQIVRSEDEGKTFLSPVDITDGSQYVVIENDHVLRMKSGRILLPANPQGFLMTMYASDDDGVTWFQLSDIYRLPYPGHNCQGLQETVVYEEESGRLRAFSRTELLCQFEAVSDDGGATWQDFYPNTFFSSPLSPMMIKRLDTMTVAVWNPTPNSAGRRVHPRTSGRTPLVLAVSREDGRDFTNTMSCRQIHGIDPNDTLLYCLEDDPENGYCYPNVFGGEDYLLVAYSHSDGGESSLGANKILKIEYSELL